MSDRSETTMPTTSPFRGQMRRAIAERDYWKAEYEAWNRFIARLELLAPTDRLPPEVAARFAHVEVTND